MSPLKQELQNLYDRLGDDEGALYILYVEGKRNSHEWRILEGKQYRRYERIAQIKRKLKKDECNRNLD